MKKLLYYSMIIIAAIGCEDVIDVDVPNGDPRLVIDASFEFSKDEDGLLDFSQDEIRLTLSAPFFDENIPTVSNATIFITNLSRDLVLTFRESIFEPGIYRPSNGSYSFNFGDEYELTVIYDNQTYKGITQIAPSSPIDAVIQGDGTLFDDDDIEIELFFTDDGDINNYYLFDFDFNLFLTSEDRFYQGQSFNFSYFYEDRDINAGKEAEIKILGIDRQYFDYSTILIEQSEQDGGNPFQTPPVRIRSNIINTTNPDNYALGYFNLSETYSFLFTFQEQ